MTYVVFHLLKTVAPSSQNRDDLNRPKSARYGGKERLRISSQCMKRTIRTSSLFFDTFGQARLGHLSRNLGLQAYEKHSEEFGPDTLLPAIAYANLVVEKGTPNISSGKGDGWGLKKGPKKTVEGIVQKYEKDGAKALRTSQSLRLHDFQATGYAEAVAHLCENGLPTNEQEATYVEELIHVTNNPSHAIDIALFGSMFTSASEYSTDGAAMFSHALSVDEVKAESDYFSAVDDFSLEGDTGAAHTGHKDFASGSLYQWVAVDVKRLVENLGGDVELAKKALQTLAKALAILNPSGNQSGMASQTLADYMRVEVSPLQPVSYVTAFEVPIKPGKEGVMVPAIAKLEEVANQYAATYGEVLDMESATFNRVSGEGTLADILNLIKSAL